MNNILGISAFYHDSAACLLKDGEIFSAAQEERFTRKKHDASFPKQSISYCLQAADINIDDVSCIVFYDKPFLKFDRLLQSYLSYAPKGYLSFLKAMPVWLKEKLYLRQLLKKEFNRLQKNSNKKLPPLLFTEHHQAHASSAFFPSPFQKAAVLCLDGVGEWATTSVWQGNENKLTPSIEINFPHSLGLLYSAFTYYTGFKVNSGEYKLMGLAPYGEPKYVSQIYENLIDLKDDGSFQLNMEYFSYPHSLRMTNKSFNQLFGAPPRKPESIITQKEMDLARSIQQVIEEVILRIAKTIHKQDPQPNLCMAGGVALNCVANGRLLREGPFKKIWVQPAAGDAGGAIGAALSAWHEYYSRPRQQTSQQDRMSGAYLGPQFSDNEIEDCLKEAGASFTRLSDNQLIENTAQFLAKKNVVGWFQGRMEFGPRALGARSILGDPRCEEMQKKINLKIKYRESFRPFAPSVMEEHVHDFFDFKGQSPYMLMVSQLHPSKKITTDSCETKGLAQLDIKRSTLPAITHVDGSARIQTVGSKHNTRFYQLLSKFYELTECPALVNTSFNVRGEPIVCTPKDALICFLSTEMDQLIIGNFILEKAKQPLHLMKDSKWQTKPLLD